MKVGIIGGGQLARMLCLAGYPLGLTFRTLDPAPDACAGPVSEQIVAPYADLDALARFADGVEVVTYEFENVDVAAAEWLNARVPVYPPPIALASSQDRLAEKTFLQAQGVPTAPFIAPDSQDALREAVSRLGLPAVLKTRRLGYDGKGQIRLRDAGDIAGAWQELGRQDLILEGFVPFDRELSLVSVRDRSGETRFYPLVQNRHQDGILRETIAPAPGLTSELQAQAEDHARRLLHALGYVGVLTIEFFAVGDQLVANEIAPRVHNSGHWTIEGAACSQFENHLRAVCNLPLGATTLVGCAAMLNIIGDLPDTRAALQTPNAHLHLYGKAPRAGRKLGHVTVRADSVEERQKILGTLTIERTGL